MLYFNRGFFKCKNIIHILALWYSIHIFSFLSMLFCEYRQYRGVTRIKKKINWYSKHKKEKGAGKAIDSVRGYSQSSSCGPHISSRREERDLPSVFLHQWLHTVAAQHDSAGSLALCWHTIKIKWWDLKPRRGRLPKSPHKINSPITQPIYP